MNVVKIAICGILCTITTLVTMTTSALSNDYYELLGVSRTANIKDIKRAYRRMAAKYHPDKNKDDPEANDKFIRLSKIHEVLTDPDKRALYDRFGEAGLDSSGQPEHRPTHFQPSQFHFDFTDMFHDEPRQEDFHFQFADFFDDVRQSDHHDNQRFHFAGFDEEELFVRQRQQRRHDNGGGRRCRTITRNLGNMIMTHTECT